MAKQLGAIRGTDQGEIIGKIRAMEERDKKEAGVEEGVMGVVGAEWVDGQGVVVATRHDCKGCYCHSC